MNRYLAILIAALTSAEMQAFQLTPRLVVNINIDQLRTDYIETFSPLFGSEGFKKLFTQGKVYDAASYNFTPIDRASAISSIATGTSPYHHGIISSTWLDHKTLRPTSCVDDIKHFASPVKLQTSTIGDELKVSSHGTSIVYGLAAYKDAAILSAGHAADNAIWIDENTGKWRTSTYYTPKPEKWLPQAPIVNATKKGNNFSTTEYNDQIAELALTVIQARAMGVDETPDLLNISLSAAPISQSSDARTEMEGVYTRLDKALGKLINNIETQNGKDKVLFVITSTGYAQADNRDYTQYRIPTGTFYINRTAKLLNVYLSAIYGPGEYVEAYYHNQIYLNHRLIGQKKVTLHEVLNRCQELLIQTTGISDVFTSERLLSGNNDIQKLRNGFYPPISGDITIEIAPGWQLVNEIIPDNYTSSTAFIPFPIIFYGNGIKAEKITTPVTVDQIAPTISKAIKIRAPNACSSAPLF
uniref:Alkaline phosphatase family protein n=1 Tax=Prevotella sp. GTC17259 TaxID=3236795 RepID=A0AB33J687_9BACT